jgi:hypothetical protein
MELRTVVSKQVLVFARWLAVSTVAGCVVAGVRAAVSS